MTDARVFNPAAIRALSAAGVLATTAAAAGCGGSGGSERRADGDAAHAAGRKCAVTTKASHRLPKDVRAYGPDWLGRGDLYVATQPPIYRAEPAADGSLAIKVAWFRRVPGRLSLSAQRLDGAGRAEATAPADGYPDTGPLPSNVTVSAPGCWKVTGHLASTTVDAVIRVSGQPASP
ncbi:MAG TPA: hypothetical protein VM266_14335 [Solirubrobacteraceae bacterium]|nr:hypothetical protein [Solirubrobacteraceae bacterium]